jgi:hypothetical protein
MEDTINNLAVLLLELPDPDLELSFQAPSTFTCFPQLPTELRLKIWRLTFPKLTYFWEQRTLFYRWALRMPQPPASASINYESREETLKHYTLLLRTEIILYEHHKGCYRRYRRLEGSFCVGTDNQRVRTVYWNPTRETMISTFYHSIYQSQIEMYPEVRPAITSVRKLQLLVRWWIISTAELIMGNEAKGNGLYDFLELLELQLIRSSGFEQFTDARRVNEDNIQEFIDCYGGFFERRLARGEIRQFPKITAWKWGKGIIGLEQIRPKPA